MDNDLVQLCHRDVHAVVCEARVTAISGQHLATKVRVLVKLCHTAAMDSDGAQVVILHALAHQLAHVVAAWLQVDAVSTIVAVFVHRDRASWCPTAHIAVSPLANPLSGKSLPAVVLGTTLVVNSTPMVLDATLVVKATMVLDATLVVNATKVLAATLVVNATMVLDATLVVNATKVLAATLEVNATMVLAATLEHATMVLDATLPCDFFVVALPPEMPAATPSPPACCSFCSCRGLARHLRSGLSLDQVGDGGFEAVVGWNVAFDEVGLGDRFVKVCRGTRHCDEREEKKLSNAW